MQFINERIDLVLFRKKHPRSCTYCTRGTVMDGTQVLCQKRGFVPTEHACRKFKYDPCKRIPNKPKALNFKKYTQDDFSL